MVAAAACASGPHDNDYDQDRIIRADNVDLHDSAEVHVPRAAARRLPGASGWRLLEQQFWGAGLLTGWCGMTRSLLPDIGLEEG